MYILKFFIIWTRINEGMWSQKKELNNLRLNGALLALIYFIAKNIWNGCKLCKHIINERNQIISCKHGNI